MEKSHKTSVLPPVCLALRWPWHYLDAACLLLQLLHGPLDPLCFLLGSFQGLFQKGL